MNNDINTILLDLKNKSVSNPNFMTIQQQNFWSALSKNEIIQISDIILHQNNNLSKLNKYSITEINYIFNMFPLEIINKKIKSIMDKLSNYGIYSIMDYRIYNTNLKLIKNIKSYKKFRLKQEKLKQKDNKNGK